MDQINEIVAGNFKQIRETKKMSLDMVSKLTGVSRSMLNQIEKGEVNPTISTVWKIANGLKVSFTELVTAPKQQVNIIRYSAIEPLIEKDGDYRNYPLFPFDSERKFEVYRIELEPGAKLEAQPHPVDSQELITVYQGGLELSVTGNTYVLAAGDAIKFVADVEHTYYNGGKVLTVLNMIICYR